MSKRKLLLADDSVTIQKVVNLTFADEGIEVVAVGDGDSAMDKLAEISPDLVMADVNMPGMNGYQICEQIRQDEALKQTPVILLVGSFEPFDEAEAARVGADDYLTKPFQSIRQLVNKVTVLLNAEREPHPADERHLADTLEMENPPVVPLAETAQPVEFEDSGMDDEMIQTSSYALDESSKFETREPVSEADLAKTQPLTNDEIKDFELVDSAAEAVETATVEEEAAADTIEDEAAEAETAQIIEDEEKIVSEEPDETEDSVAEIAETAETIDETESAETTEEATETVSEEIEESAEETAETVPEETVETVAETAEIAGTVTEETDDHPAEVAEETVAETHEEAIPMPEVASILQIDEANPLELPPIEYDGDSQEDELEDSDETTVETAKPETADAEQISPDLIEAIANRVLEKLSDQAVKEIAWEVVPQHADLIIKKMVEEKLNEK